MNIPNEHLPAIRYGLELQIRRTDIDDDVKAKAQAALNALENADDFEMKPLSDNGKKTAFIPERLQQKYKVMMFNVKLLLDQIYPRSVWPGPPDYENGDSGSVLVKQAWVAVEAVEKELTNAKG